MPRKTHPLQLALPIVLFLNSCSEEKIRVYKIASDPAPESSAAAAVPEAASGTPRVTWQAPAGWKTERPGQFQNAVFSVSASSQVAISMLSGDSGGIAANINRWRGQIGLEELPESGIVGESLKIASGKGELLLFRLIPEDASAAADAMLGAILPLDSETWYFKFTGPAGELRESAHAFTEFLASVRVDGAPAVSSPAHAEHAHASVPESRSSATALPKVNLSPPPDWQPGPGSSMRAASFSITGGSASADISVIPLPGNSGDMLGTVNLWRAQLKLPPLDSLDDPSLGTELEGAAGTWFLSHLTSNAPIAEGKDKAAISGAVLKSSGRHTWYFKIFGDATLVEANREKFEAFVRSATFP